MGLQKLSSTDAFVVIDLDAAPCSDGLLRCARKVLVDGARTMARSRTYSWALLGEQVSGASAGINAAGDGRDAAVAAFVAEVSEQVGSGCLALDAGKGVAGAELATLAATDGRSPLVREIGDELLGIGVAAAADVALGGIAGATAVVEGAGSAADAVVGALHSAGAQVVATGDGVDIAVTDADLLVCGSKLGLVDHGLAARIPQRAVVPCAPAPFTAKGLAVAQRRGIVVVADFVPLMAPLLAFRPGVGATADSLRVEADDLVREVTTEAVAHPEGAYVGAARRAEVFLERWLDDLPFGRPLA